MTISRELRPLLDGHGTTLPTGNPVSNARPHSVDLAQQARLSRIRPVRRSGDERFRNHLLADNAHADFPLDDFERVELGQKAVLCEPGDAFSYIYFPESAVVSFVTSCGRHAPIEVATVGREGMVGLPVFLGADSGSVRAVVKVRGIAERIRVAAFRAWAGSDAVLQSRMLHYMNAFITQLTHTATCNAVHLVEERCARWLLVTHDRTDGAELEITHDFLAALLGVRRPGITTVMNSLKEQRLVWYSRGRLTIVNRQGLERVACACYQHMRSAENTRELANDDITRASPGDRCVAIDT